MQIHIYCKKPEVRTSERNYITNQKTYRWHMNVLGQRAWLMVFQNSMRI